MEARLSEEKTRRERDRVLGEIEAIKYRLKQAISAFAPVIGELCEATKMAAAGAPDARELKTHEKVVGQKRSGFKRAWVQHREGEDKDWAGTGRYLNVVRVDEYDKGPSGNATDFPKTIGRTNSHSVCVVGLRNHWLRL